MANSSETRTGTAYTGQVHLSKQAELPFHAVRNDDPAIVALRASLGDNSTEVDIYPAFDAGKFGTRNPNTNGHLNVPNGAAVLVNDQGRLEVATSVSANAFNTIGVKTGDKYYVKGMVAGNYGVGLIMGKEYWLQTSGVPSTAYPTQTGEWAIKVGIAINSTDLLITMDVQGLVG